ncbi:ras GEF [Panus rudis PR-1116 ss-1]|nr:ras GEF [Panus rudis PR-1116 ss-1]
MPPLLSDVDEGRSSPSSSATGSPAYETAEYPPPPSSLLAPPAGLKKSLSVDSFMKHRLAQHALVRPARSNTRAQAPGPHLVSSEGVSREPSPSAIRGELRPTAMQSRPDQDRNLQRRTVPARSRGTSVTAADKKYVPSLAEDSDGERLEELRLASERSMKGKAASRPMIPEGELTLPPRLPNHTAVSNTPPPPSPLERKSTQPHKPAKRRSPISVNTHLSPRTDITLAVIGTHGCGKSTLIRKGLKPYGLSDPRPVETPHVPPELRDELRCTVREGRLPMGSNTSEPNLRVYEIDVPSANPTHVRLASNCIDLSCIDGLVLCFRPSQQESLDCIRELLSTVSRYYLPTIAAGLRVDESDPDQKRNMVEAYKLLRKFEIGIVKSTIVQEEAKAKMTEGFEFLIGSITRHRTRSSRNESTRNPASPAILESSTLNSREIARSDSTTPTASSSTRSPLQAAQIDVLGGEQQPFFNTSRKPEDSVSSAITRSARETHSPLSTVHPEDLQTPRTEDFRHTTPASSTQQPPSNVAKAGNPSGSAPLRAPPWVSLDDLLDKLLFVAVSDDDPVYINHFLLTYRRFAAPRAILLAMQRRMRSLDEPTGGDPMFACFAQMKICCLLDTWMRTYAHDFAVPGTAGALSALIKSIVGKTYLLHYGSEFIPFMENLPTLKDKDASWAMKVESPHEDSDDSSSLAETSLRTPESPMSSRSTHSLYDSETIRSSPQSHHMRERKSSLPLSRFVPKSSGLSNGSDRGGPSHKEILNRLVSFSNRLEKIDPTEIAQEICRLECEYFLKIEPRHWLQHVLGNSKKDDDPISRFNWLSNHIGAWVQSMILCHEKPRIRARYIEKFAEVASRLRIEHNYSALRAVVAGVNGATFDGDPSFDLYRQKNPSSWKNFQSFDQLLQSIRSHQKYRMALRNTKGQCIPALEIHLSDLIRAHEGNPDFHDDDPSKIHWAKFNMMGRFIDTIVSCQKACRDLNSYNYPKKYEIYETFCIENPHWLMVDELQAVRHPAPSDLEGTADGQRPDLSRPPDTQHYAPQKGGLGRIFFWNPT